MEIKNLETRGFSVLFFFKAGLKTRLTHNMPWDPCILSTRNKTCIMSSLLHCVRHLIRIADLLIGVHESQI